MTLAPFNARALCPKCGYHDVRALFHRDGHEPGCVLKAALARDDIHNGQCCREHIDRLCVRCLHRWAEAPAELDDEGVDTWLRQQLEELALFAAGHGVSHSREDLIQALRVEVPARIKKILEPKGVAA